MIYDVVAAFYASIESTSISRPRRKSLHILSCQTFSIVVMQIIIINSTMLQNLVKGIIYLFSPNLFSFLMSLSRFFMIVHYLAVEKI